MGLVIINKSGTPEGFPNQFVRAYCDISLTFSASHTSKFKYFGEGVESLPLYGNSLYDALKQRLPVFGLSYLTNNGVVLSTNIAVPFELNQSGSITLCPYLPPGLSISPVIYADRGRFPALFKIQ